MRYIILAMALSAVPVPAVNAQAMPVSTFLAKADALKAKGSLALLSGDLKRLKKEVEASAGLLRSERLAAVRAGTKPAFCPPEQPVSLNSDDILVHFRSIPAAQRPRTTVKDAMRSLMARRHPCPA